jgi:hypothetical protein
MFDFETASSVDFRGCMSGLAIKTNISSTHRDQCSIAYSYTEAVCANAVLLYNYSLSLKYVIVFYVQIYVFVGHLRNSL